MTKDPMDAESRRVNDQIVERLRARGVASTRHDSPEGLVRLLEAVEEFERTVERKGGDLMVDEPVGGTRPLSPDAAAFVLPTRTENETIAAFIVRIAKARDRAAQAAGGRPRGK
jgi:hypothetical protein